MKRDMRRVNRVWGVPNPEGEWFVYALIGTGKNSYIKTSANGAAAEAFRNLVGTIASKKVKK